MSQERSYRIWIDASGEVWIEDPDAGVMPLAQSLQPDFAWGGLLDVLGPPAMAATRAVAVPLPWPEELDGLWALHDEALGRRAAAVAEPEVIAAAQAPTLLDLKLAIARRLARACVFCEHRCGVDRPAGERGVCRVGPTSYVAAGYVHLAEEREIAPSFCVTLTGCSWHCVYCHTFDVINRVDHGTPLDEAHADLYARAAAPEVRTLSFVGGNPDHHLPAILAFLAAAPATFARPVVWNSNQYGSPELYRLLDGVVDVWLGDFKYGNDACAERLSGIARCWEPVARNWRQVAAQGGLLLPRVLALPGHLDCCVRPIVRFIAEALPGARVSLLDQYHPTYLVAKRAPELDRLPDPAEIAAARALLLEAGVRLSQPVEGAGEQATGPGSTRSAPEA